MHILALTAKEIKAFNRCEQTIDRGQKTFIEVGNCLAEIRENRYYRADYETFKDYCKDRWGFKDSRARQLIAAAKSVEVLESVTTVTVPNEAVARELNKLPEEKRKAAWLDVVDECEDRKQPITAAAVAAKMDAYKADAEPYRDDDDGEPDRVADCADQDQKPSDEARAKSKAIFRANEAVDALKRIPKNDPLRKRGFQIVTDWIKLQLKADGDCAKCHEPGVVQVEGTADE